MEFTRRKMLAGLALVGAAAMMPRWAAGEAKCPFRLAVINDEITAGLREGVPDRWPAISGCGGSSCAPCGTRTSQSCNDKEIADARKILEKHKLQVTDIASPLFKTDWPGAPRSPKSENRDQFHAELRRQRARQAARALYFAGQNFPH